MLPFNMSLIDIDHCTIIQMQEALEQGKMTSRELVLYYLWRIALLDQDGPTVNAILEINPDAIFIAEALDLERAELGSRGRLHGIPLLIKGNIGTADKMHTSAGALALEHHFADEDAYLVKKLREAGAIILGKTNLTELANSVSYSMPNGFSSLGGQVKNPYGLFDTGGSSTGSAAAIAMNFAIGAIGTETSGSILDPSLNMSVVGLKPSVGLISRTGIIPFSTQQDTAGPMAKSVSDIAVILEVLTSKDDDDPATWRKPSAYENINYSERLEPFSLQGVTIGVYQQVNDPLSREDMYNEPLFKEVLTVFENAGANLIHDIELPIHRQWKWNKLNAEAKHNFDYYLSKKTTLAELKTLEDLIVWNDNHSSEALKYGQQGLVDKQQFVKPLANKHYIRELVSDLIESQHYGIDYAMDKYNLDVILFPLDLGSDLSARAGYPTLALSVGYLENGQPYGITLAGNLFDELLLLQIGNAFEKLTRGRELPLVYNAFPPF